MTWSTPEDLKAQIQRRWERGELLAARVNGAALFPLRLRLTKPDARAVTERFDDVRRWIQALVDGSRERRGYGYTLEWREVRHRVHGQNSVPEAVVVPSEADALRLIGKARQGDRFEELSRLTISRFPELREWLARRPFSALEHAADWSRVLSVLEYFIERPRPGLYLRQLEIPDVDTKFIETRKTLFTELLDRLLPEDAIDAQAAGVRNFEWRYGLRTEAPLVRFRLLDPNLYIHGLSDLSVPPEQFASLRLPVRLVVITENKINGLAFPDVSGVLVVFGLGYGLERLAQIDWLRDVAIWYWGDIDTHGFRILDQLRTRLPHVRSFLMDHDTLLAHRALWGREAATERFIGDLSLLTDAEQAIFDDLKQNRLGDQVRLEQERVAYRWLRCAIEQTVVPSDAKREA